LSGVPAVVKKKQPQLTYWTSGHSSVKHTAAAAAAAVAPPSAEPAN